MRLTYRHSAVDPQQPVPASVAHIFDAAPDPHIYAYCEMADGAACWCLKTEDKPGAPMYGIYGMQPRDPWREAVASIPASMRLAALMARSQEGGAA